MTVPAPSIAPVEVERRAREVRVRLGWGDDAPVVTRSDAEGEFELLSADVIFRYVRQRGVGAPLEMAELLLQPLPAGEPTSVVLSPEVRRFGEPVRELAQQLIEAARPAS